MVEMWSNFQSIRFVNGHVRILGRRGKLRTRMCAGGSEICTAAYGISVVDVCGTVGVGVGGVVCYYVVLCVFEEFPLPLRGGGST